MKNYWTGYDEQKAAEGFVKRAYSSRATVQDKEWVAKQAREQAEADQIFEVGNRLKAALVKLGMSEGGAAYVLIHAWDLEDQNAEFRTVSRESVFSLVNNYRQEMESKGWA